MKKTISVILLLALAFTLCACGSAAPAAPSVGDQMYEKYGSIIDKLEAGEYEKVIEEVTAMMPVAENQVVHITKDNFNDYYEVAYDVNQINKDSAGNILSMWYSGSSFFYRLKEEYREKLVSDESMVEAGMTADLVLKKVESIDWEAGTVKLSDATYDSIAKEILTTFRDMGTSISVTKSGNLALYGGESNLLNYGGFAKRNDGWGNYWGSGQLEKNGNAEYYVFAPENIQIVRAEGTLTLKG